MGLFRYQDENEGSDDFYASGEAFPSTAVPISGIVVRIPANAEQCANANSVIKGQVAPDCVGFNSQWGLP
jgi:hypothetical protein